MKANSLLRQWLANSIYLLFLLGMFPWLVWRYFSGKSRRGWRQKILGIGKFDLGDSLSRASPAKPWIWFHAVSVGEVNLLRPLVEAFTDEFSVLITTTTESGYDLAKSKFPTENVCFFPFDFSWAIRNSIRAVQPRAIVLAELEMWPNLISIADQLKVPIAVVNGRLGERSFQGYQRYQWLLGGAFQKLTFVGAQTAAIADRFVSLGCDRDRVHVTGSLKFDNAVSNQQHGRSDSLAVECGIAQDDQVLVAGSTQLEEDLMVLDAFEALQNRYSSLRIILVPRHPERCGVLCREMERRGILFQTRSTKGKLDEEHRVLIVDVIGELADWWGRADLGYVGGSMGSREGQNMIEPSAFGVPVAFGPRTRNFQDVVDQLLADNAARVIRDQQELVRLIEDRFESPESMLAMGRRAAEVVNRNLGATRKTVELLRSLMERNDP